MAIARKKIKVKDNSHLVRDSFSKAITNVDRNAFTQHRLRKKSHLDKDRKIEYLENAVNELRKEHEHLIKLVQSIVKKS
jgi:hypothetical protein